MLKIFIKFCHFKLHMEISTTIKATSYASVIFICTIMQQLLLLWNHLRKGHTFHMTTAMHKMAELRILWCFLNITSAYSDPKHYFLIESNTAEHECLHFPSMHKLRTFKSYSKVEIHLWEIGTYCLAVLWSHQNLIKYCSVFHRTDFFWIPVYEIILTMTH